MRFPLTRLTLATALFVTLATRSTAHAHGYYRYGPPPPPPPPHRYQYAPYGPPVFVPYLYLGGALGGTGVVTQSGGPEALGSGAGGSLFLGLRLLPSFALELGVLESFHNPADTIDLFGDYAGTSYVVLTGFTGDALFHLLAHSRGIDPYLQAGLGLYALGRDVFGTSVSGWGFQLGGGIDFWLGRQVTLGGRVLYRGILMSEVEAAQPDTFIHAITGEVRLAIHFR